MNNIKLGLTKTREEILDVINNGDDLIVNTLTIYGTQIKPPKLQRDTEPRICDFLSAGIDKELIAYYFAYLVVSPHHIVISKKYHKELDSTDISTMADDYRFERIKKEILPKVLKEKELRKNKEKNKEL